MTARPDTLTTRPVVAAFAFPRRQHGCFIDGQPVASVHLLPGF